ncbi:hypothetical protein [Caballeronia sp. J97]|uniref:hypothetical protein n=1 Tax=Caballeronia sp. J97 TaxID=2805429 RepID=UPI002AB1BB25|nr:hypothetical protein [Caballeronia sp. J97]
MTEVYDKGRARKKWIVTSQAAFAMLEKIVCLYDCQVHAATLGELEGVNARLARFKSGEPYRSVQKRGA